MRRKQRRVTDRNGPSGKVFLSVSALQHWRVYPVDFGRIGPESLIMKTCQRWRGKRKDRLIDKTITL
jgi:hypothetical protein